MSYHGYNPIKADEEHALPNATTNYTEAWQYVGPTNYKQILKVYANTDISIATGEDFTIEFVTGATATPTTPLIAESHTYLLSKTSADGVLAFDAGDLLCEFALPDELMTDDYYYRLKVTTTGNEATEKIDVLLVGAV